MSDLLAWIFTGLALAPFFPLWFSAWAFLVLSQFDFAARGWASATGINVGDAIKVVLVPAVLFIRASWGRHRLFAFTGPLKWWVALLVWSSITVVWSPFRLPALKQIAYFLSYSVLTITFTRLFLRDRRRMQAIVMVAVLCALALGVLRGAIQPDTEGRFTSFTSPQGFALFLVVSLIVMVTFKAHSAPQLAAKIVLMALTAVAIYATGSRTGLAASVVVVGFWILGSVSIVDERRRLRLLLAGGAGLACATIVTGLLWYAVSVHRQRGLHTTSRSLQAVAALASGRSLETISTFAWRIGMYERMLSDIGSRPAALKVIGRGTGSAAQIITKGGYWLRGYNRSTVDANRIAHDEYLRALYEWGGIGLLLLGGVVVASLRFAWDTARTSRDASAYMLVGGVVVIAGYMLVENVLAGAGSAMGAAVIVTASQIAALGQAGHVA